MSQIRAAIGYAAATLLAAVGLASDNLLALTGAALMVALVGMPPGTEQLTSEATAPPAQDTASSRLRRALWASAVIASLGAACISLAAPPLPLAGWLWLASLGLLAGLGIVHDGIRSVSISKWLKTWRTHAVEIVSVGGITLAAFLLRVVNLDMLPPVIHGDEGEMGVIVRGLLAGYAPPLFEASPFFSLPYVFNYLQAGALLVFGQDLFGLRMLSVLVGTACIPLCYLVARAGWGMVPGLAAAWLFAAGHISIHYSRLGFVFIESMFCVLAMLAVVSAVANSAPGRTGYTPFIAAGALLGLGQYFYFASRAMPFILAPLLAHLWLSRRATLPQMLALGAATMVVFAPLGAYFLMNADVFLDRVGFVSILRDANASQALGRQTTVAADWLPLLQLQLTRTLGLFARGGDGGGFYFQNIPAFDAITAVLCWLGMGGALARPTRWHELAVIIWFGVGTVLGGVLTIDAPSAQRLTIMLPAVCVLGAVAIARGQQLLGSVRWQVPAHAVGGLALAVLAVLVYAANTDLYFRQYANGTQGREAGLIARLASAEPPGTHFVLFGTPVVFSNHGAIRFLAPNARFADPPSAAEMAFRPADGPLLLFAVPDRLADARAVQAQYGGGTWTEHVDPLGRLFLVTYRLP